MVTLKSRVRRNGKNENLAYRSIRDAAAAAGLPYMTVYMRLKKLGWPLSQALKVPVHRRSRMYVTNELIGAR